MTRRRPPFDRPEQQGPVPLVEAASASEFLDERRRDLEALYDPGFPVWGLPPEWVGERSIGGFSRRRDRARLVGVLARKSKGRRPVFDRVSLLHRTGEAQLRVDTRTGSATASENVLRVELAFGLVSAPAEPGQAGGGAVEPGVWS